MPETTEHRAGNRDWSGGKADGARPCVVLIVDDDASRLPALQRLLATAGYAVRSYPAAGIVSDANPDLAGYVLLDPEPPPANEPRSREELKTAGDPVPIIFMTSGEFRRRGAPVWPWAAAARTPLADGRAPAAAAAPRSHPGPAESADDGGDRQELARRFASLTPREKQVFALVTRGHTNKQVAAELGINIKTVKVHRARAMAKMEAGSLAELVRMAVKIAVLVGDG